MAISGVSIGSLVGTLEFEDNATKSLQQFDNQLRNATTRGVQLSGALDSMAGRMVSTGLHIQYIGDRLTLLTAGITGLGGAVVKMAMDFETSMMHIGNLTDIGTEHIKEMSDAVMKMAPEVGKGPQELADALYSIGSVGFTGAKALDILTLSAKGSAIGLGETKEIAKALSAAMIAYGDSGLTAKHALDVLLVGVKEGGAEADQFANTLGRVIAQADLQKVSFEELVASVAVYTRVGVRADEAVTALRGTLAFLAKPSAEARAELVHLGSSIEEVRDKVAKDGLAATLIDLIRLTGGNADSFAKLIPNVRASAGALANAASQADTYKGVVREMRQATDDSDKAFANVSQTVQFKFNQALASLKVVGTELGSALLPAFVKLLEAVKPLINELAALVTTFTHLPKVVQEATLAFGGLLLALGPILSILGRVQNVIGLIGTLYIRLTAQTVAETAAVEANTVATTADTVATELNSAAKTKNAGSSAAKVAALQAEKLALEEAIAAQAGLTAATTATAEAQLALNFEAEGQMLLNFGEALTIASSKTKLMSGTLASFTAETAEAGGAAAVFTETMEGVAAVFSTVGAVGTLVIGSVFVAGGTAIAEMTGKGEEWKGFFKDVPVLLGAMGNAIKQSVIYSFQELRKEFYDFKGGLKDIGNFIQKEMPSVWQEMGHVIDEQVVKMKIAIGLFKTAAAELKQGAANLRSEGDILAGEGKKPVIHGEETFGDIPSVSALVAKFTGGDLKNSVNELGLAFGKLKETGQLTPKVLENIGAAAQTLQAEGAVLPKFLQDIVNGLEKVRLGAEGTNRTLHPFTENFKQVNDQIFKLSNETFKELKFGVLHQDMADFIKTAMTIPEAMKLGKEGLEDFYRTVKSAKAEQEKADKLHAAQLVEMDKLEKLYYDQVNKYSETSNQAKIRHVQEWADKYKDELVKTGKANEELFAMIDKVSKATMDNLTMDMKALREGSIENQRAKLQEEIDVLNKTLQEMEAKAYDYTRKQIDDLRDKIRSLYQMLEHPKGYGGPGSEPDPKAGDKTQKVGEAIDNTKKKTEEATAKAGEWGYVYVKAAENIKAATAQAAESVKGMGQTVTREIEKIGKAQFEALGGLKAIKAMEAYFQSYPGAAPGGTGATGAYDLRSWNEMQKRAETYTQLKEYYKSHQDEIDAAEAEAAIPWWQKRMSRKTGGATDVTSASSRPSAGQPVSVTRHDSSGKGEPLHLNIASGAFVFNYPIMNDPKAKNQLKQHISQIFEESLAGKGVRLLG
jgi:TP901 family phage tail tape measure protein